MWFQIQMFSYLRKFDIIHVYHPYFALSGYLAKLFFKKKLYITLIGWDNYNPLKKAPTLDKIVRFFSNRADMLFASSKDLLLRAHNQKITKKIIEIPHGINMPKKIKSDIRKKYGIDNKILYIYVGRLVSVKNPLFMLKAWKEVKDNNLFLLIVGDGPLKEDMKYYIKKNNLKNVGLTGFISDKELKEVYSSADVLIHYAIYESFGLSILEGMSYGLPIIASKTGAIPELVNEVGELMELNDINSLKKAIRNISKNIKYLKNNSLEKAKKYQWKDIVKEYIKYY